MKKCFVLFLCISCSEHVDDNRRYAFITKNLYEGFLLGGVSGADEKCSQEALRVGLISQDDYINRKYKAWISTEKENAKDRINGLNEEGTGLDYYTTNEIFIGNYLDIIKSNLKNPINIEPDGKPEENFMSYVWTGTKENGVILDINYDCNDWNLFNENSTTGLAGSSNSINHNWTYTESPKNCIAEYKLYCFES